MSGDMTAARAWLDTFAAVGDPTAPAVQAARTIAAHLDAEPQCDHLPPGAVEVNGDRFAAAVARSEGAATLRATDLRTMQTAYRYFLVPTTERPAPPTTPGSVIRTVKPHAGVWEYQGVGVWTSTKGARADRSEWPDWPQEFTVLYDAGADQ